MITTCRMKYSQLTISKICVNVKPNLTGTGRLEFRTGRTLLE